MQAAYLPRRHDADCSAPLHDPSTAPYRLGGVLLGTCISTAFWLFALMLASSAAGIALAASTLTLLAMAVAVISCIMLAVVVVEHR